MKILDGNWYLASIFNVGMLFFSVVFINKIGNHIGIPISNKLLFFLFYCRNVYIYSRCTERFQRFFFSALSFYF